jgi:hypothetical protein
MTGLPIVLGNHRYGADIGSSLTFAPGVYLVAAGVEMKPATGLGTVIVRVSTGGVGGTFGAGTMSISAEI